jgi:hypothetical protein
VIDAGLSAGSAHIEPWGRFVRPATAADAQTPRDTELLPDVSAPTDHARTGRGA